MKSEWVGSEKMYPTGIRGLQWEDIMETFKCGQTSWGFPCSSVSEESACSTGDPGSSPGLGRFPGEGNGNPLQYAWPGKSHVQHSLVGCSSWGHKELGMTELLTLLTLTLN